MSWHIAICGIPMNLMTTRHKGPSARRRELQVFSTVSNFATVEADGKPSPDDHFDFEVIIFAEIADDSVVTNINRTGQILSDIGGTVVP